MTLQPSENCVKKIVYGTLESCMKVFKYEVEKYPPQSYGTHIFSKLGLADQCKVVIKRFKTKDIYREYLFFKSQNNLKHLLE
tara:strand:+ start:17533 stop:17778 length:246 start_codon:yes stop_codon:yes gene_type:complete